MTNLNVQENNEQITSLLQEALNAETSSRNLYFARSIFWCNAGFERLADYYKGQSEEDHAQLNADRLAFLGGIVSLTPTSVSVGGEDSTIIDQYNTDLQVEIALAENYAENIKVAEDAGDWITAKIWKKVLKSTQEHIAYLEQELKKVELVGLDNYLASWI
jgi:bacterioferritin